MFRSSHFLVCTILVLLCLACVGCAGPELPPPAQTAPTAPETTVPETTVPETTVPETTVPETTVPETQAPTTLPPETAPLHSSLYHPEFDADYVIQCFREVSLDAEFVNGGDASLLQKWMIPIRYVIHGTPTQEDLATIQDFAQWLNALPGFPGMEETADPLAANLQIYFCSYEELLNRMGDQFVGCDGGVTFWYLDNEIYDATICIRNDLDQQLRNSVILEEIYNGLGPVQDTLLRPDSVIASVYSSPQALTPMDELILELLYHPEMICGMTAEECEAVIRRLYY